MPMFLRNPKLLVCCCLLCLLGAKCSPKEAPKENAKLKPKPPFAQISSGPNEALNFDAPAAINAVVEIENPYFAHYDDSLSPYYGTVWREQLEQGSNGRLWFDRYRKRLSQKPDSMHCTIYAVKALKAGMGEDFVRLQQAHQQIWGNREHAGWSIGYLLVRDWGWKAYHILDSTSTEFAQCQRAFRRNQKYPVWRQPDIPLEAQYIRGKDDSLIVSLLKQHEFGWGFSDQGYHTWITRREVLKECNWLGAPGREMEFGSNLPLFLKRPFMKYFDYHSHVVILPPLKSQKPASI